MIGEEGCQRSGLVTWMSKVPLPSVSTALSLDPFWGSERVPGCLPQLDSL